MRSVSLSDLTDGLGGTDVALEPFMGQLGAKRISRLRAKHVWVFSVLLLLSCVGTAQAANLTLTWDRSPEADVGGYVVSYGNQSGVYPISVDVGPQVSSQIMGLVDGLPYYFVVRAYNTAGMFSGPSVKVSRRGGIPMSVPGDFDHDSKADITIYRPSAGRWYVRLSSGNYATTASYQWGTS